MCLSVYDVGFVTLDDAVSTISPSFSSFEKSNLLSHLTHTVHLLFLSLSFSFSSFTSFVPLVTRLLETKWHFQKSIMKRLLDVHETIRRSMPFICVRAQLPPWLLLYNFDLVYHSTTPLPIQAHLQTITPTPLLVQFLNFGYHRLVLVWLTNMSISFIADACACVCVRVHSHWGVCWVVLLAGLLAVNRMRSSATRWYISPIMSTLLCVVECALFLAYLALFTHCIAFNLLPTPTWRYALPVPSFSPESLFPSVSASILLLYPLLLAFRDRPAPCFSFPLRIASLFHRFLDSACTGSLFLTLLLRFRETWLPPTSLRNLVPSTTYFKFPFSLVNSIFGTLWWRHDYGYLPFTYCTNPSPLLSLVPEFNPTSFLPSWILGSIIAWTLEITRFCIYGTPSFSHTTHAKFSLQVSLCMYSTILYWYS